MTEQVISTQQVSEGNAPKRVSLDEYLEKYAHDHFEWDNGELIAVSPVRGMHNDLMLYLADLIRAYFSFRPIGIVRADSFLVRLDDLGVMREPDVLVILNESADKLTETAMLGAPDICMEIISPESYDRDFGKKFTEYQMVGVKEYWQIDYLRHQAFFHRLNDEGLLMLQEIDADGNYETPLLPDLKVHVPTLWVDPLPDLGVIYNSVRVMLSE